MLLAVATITFLATVCFLMVVVYVSSPQGVDVARRLARVLNPPSVGEEALANSTGEQAKSVLVSLGKLIPTPKGKKASRDQTLLIRAGYRGEESVLVIRGVKLILG